MTPSNSVWKRFTNSQVFWPLVALALIMLFNAIFTPGFFRLEIKDGHLFGSLIDIINRGAPLMVLAIGMTMVIATAGVDLSVGAVVAISAAVATVLINPALGQAVDRLRQAGAEHDRHAAAGGDRGRAGSSRRCAACGTVCWCPRGNIQPMVATLVLMVAGRGIAQFITGGQIITVYFTPYFFIGNGYLAGVPFTLFIVAAVFLIAWLLTRKTAVGMFVESVGINATSSFYSGINEKNIKLLVYTVSGLCAGVAGLIISSNIKSADANNAGLGYRAGRDSGRGDRRHVDVGRPLFADGQHHRRAGDSEHDHHHVRHRRAGHGGPGGQGPGGVGGHPALLAAVRDGLSGLTERKGARS